MARYLIFVYQSKNITLIDEQPKDGFETDKEAEAHLLDLIEAKKGYYFDRDWYKFVILKTYK